MKIIKNITISYFDKNFNRFLFNIYKYLILFFLIYLITPAYLEAKRAAIIIDYETNHTLFEVNADTLNYPASLAKMMTLYMTFEALEEGLLKWDQKLKVSETASSRSPSKLYLETGSYITVNDAVMALIIKSANDVATVISESLAESERKFAKKMTAKARELGMKNTTFKNASGLPNRAQLTTARDIAILSRSLIRDYPKYYQLFKEEKFVWKDKTYKNHNKLLKSYPGADGIKTGYIRASGFQLAFSAVRDNRRLIGVYFGGDTAKHRDNTLKFLMNKEFGEVFAEIKSFGEYKIVVGTFKYKKNAKKQIKFVSKNFPKTLKNKSSQIIKRKGQTRVWFETQFLSFNKKEAYKACSTFKKNKVDCFVKKKI
tara:strand:- start:1291 stop:2406 length:1116 start_codon:yes stop_codon:yes gene_type:complete